MQPHERNYSLCPQWRRRTGTLTVSSRIGRPFQCLSEELVIGVRIGDGSSALPWVRKAGWALWTWAKGPPSIPSSLIAAFLHFPSFCVPASLISLRTGPDRCPHPLLFTSCFISIPSSLALPTPDVLLGPRTLNGPNRRLAWPPRLWFDWPNSLFTSPRHKRHQADWSAGRSQGTADQWGLRRRGELGWMEGGEGGEGAGGGGAGQVGWQTHNQRADRWELLLSSDKRAQLVQDTQPDPRRRELLFPPCSRLLEVTPPQPRQNKKPQVKGQCFTRRDSIWFIRIYLYPA